MASKYNGITACLQRYLIAAEYIEMYSSGNENILLICVKYLCKEIIGVNVFLSTNCIDNSYSKFMMVMCS